MQVNKVTSILMSLLVGSMVVATAGFLKNAYAADDNWYVGKGAKPNTYVTYQIQDADLNYGRPFTLTIYFEKQDSAGNWIAPMFAVDQGQVFNATLNLGPADLSVNGAASQIPDATKPYIGGYKDSIQWLSGLPLVAPGLSLSAASWGKTGSIGGSEIKPSGTETVTVQGGTFDTTKIVYHKSVDSIIWINKDFPFPVKALTYQDRTSGSPEIQYKYELLETGSGKPKQVESAFVAPKPPLEHVTPPGDYFINLDWAPASITPGSETAFTVSFFDNSHKPLQAVSYDFKVTDAKGNAIVDRTNQFTSTASDQQKVTFKDGGPVKVSVTIIAVGSRDPGSFIQSVDFNIVVTPEFPIALVAMLAAAVMAIPIIARNTKLRGIFSA